MVTRIYANVVAKYNEGKLLDAEKLRRLADADFADAVKMLCDYGYGGGTLGEGSYDVDAFISAETGKLIDYARTCSPDENLSYVLTARFVYGNAKAYYKGKLSGKQNDAAVYRADDEEMRAAIEKGEYAALPAPMADALAELDGKFSSQAPDPKIIDVALTRAMYADMLSHARKGRSKALRAFVTAQIDTANILSALRARALKMPLASLDELFVEGGKLPKEDLNALYAADDPAAFLQETPYEFLTGEKGEASLPQIEARVDDYLAQIWEKQAENMQSLSPFVRYFIAQLGEYKTVKMILTCLKHDARDELAVRMRRIV